jgi:hypothetical protein
MRVIRESSEAEMIATFLQAEIDSPQWGRYFDDLDKYRLTEAMIREPDWENPTENKRREQLLGSYRHWGRDQLTLFQGWPTDLRWLLVTLTREDLTNVRCIGEKGWFRFTNGTLKIADGVERINRGDADIPENIRVDAIKEIADEIREGRELIPLIMIGKEDGSKMAVVEGNTRITAFQMSGADMEIDVLLGVTDVESLQKWIFYPAEET